MSSVNTRPTAQLSPPPTRSRSNRSAKTSYTPGVSRTMKNSRRNFHRPKKHPLEKHPRPSAVNTTRDGRYHKQTSKTGKNARKTGNAPDEKLKEGPRKTLKVYRRKKVLRNWVLPALFFVPLGMIWLEYYIGKLIGLEDIRDAYQDQVLDPWGLLMQDLNASRIRETGSKPALAKVAYAPRMQCPPGQRRMMNVHNPLSHKIGSRERLIPMIVHQQSKSRCLTMKVDRATVKWAFRRWSYYIHDEDSRNRLFDGYCGDGTPKCEFPLLNRIVNQCLTNTRNQFRDFSLKIELWKFLTLWIFGGVYADLDLLPVKFTPTTIDKYDDGFLLIDPDTHMLSTKLMAVSPRHPVMYYAVQQMLLNILMQESSSSQVEASIIAQKGTANREFESRVSGSSILSQAFRMFQEGSDKAEGESSNFSPGVFQGAMNRTVRLVATNGLNIKTQTKNGLVMSIFESKSEKEAEYKKMGVVVDVEEDGSPTSSSTSSEEGWTKIYGGSCLEKLYHSA